MPMAIRPPSAITAPRVLTTLIAAPRSGRAAAQERKRLASAGHITVGGWRTHGAMPVRANRLLRCIAAVSESSDVSAEPDGAFACHLHPGTMR
jgi:hypothetical protein